MNRTRYLAVGLMYAGIAILAVAPIAVIVVLSPVWMPVALYRWWRSGNIETAFGQTFTQLVDALT